MKRTWLSKACPFYIFSLHSVIKREHLQFLLVGCFFVGFFFLLLLMLKEILGYHICFRSHQSNLKDTFPIIKFHLSSGEYLCKAQRFCSLQSTHTVFVLHPFSSDNSSVLYHFGHSAKTDFSAMNLFRQIPPKYHVTSLIGGICFCHCSITDAVS